MPKPKGIRPMQGTIHRKFVSRGCDSRDCMTYINVLISGPAIPKESDWNPACEEYASREPHFRLKDPIVCLCHPYNSLIRDFGDND
jgi:hypothetical protein